MFVEKPLKQCQLGAVCGEVEAFAHFFLENANGSEVTVNGERYRSVQTAALWPQIEVVYFDDL